MTRSEKIKVAKKAIRNELHLIDFWATMEWLVEQGDMTEDDTDVIIAEIGNQVERITNNFLNR